MCHFDSFESICSNKFQSKYFNVKTCSSCKYNNDGSCNEAKAVVAGMPQQVNHSFNVPQTRKHLAEQMTNPFTRLRVPESFSQELIFDFQFQLWIAVILAICCSLLAFISFLAWNHKRKSKHIHDLPFQKVFIGPCFPESHCRFLKSIFYRFLVLSQVFQGNEDDIRENVIQYAEEAGEQDAADPTIGYRAVQKNSRFEEAANEVAKLKRCTSEDNFNGAPWDSRLLYKYEGSNSVLNSLSSINTNMTDRSIDLRVSFTSFKLDSLLNHCSKPALRLVS